MEAVAVRQNRELSLSLVELAASTDFLKEVEEGTARPTGANACACKKRTKMPTPRRVGQNFPSGASAQE